jgi:hypothetical protein
VLSVISSVHAFTALQHQRKTQNLSRCTFQFSTPSVRHRSVCLAAGNNKEETVSLSQRLRLKDQFDRWKFLQDLLDDYQNDDDIHQVLFAVLDGFVKYPPPAPKDDDDESTKIITATPQQKAILRDILDLSSASQSVEALSKEEIMEKLELLLPDPVEEEDAFKSAWDTVLELHGRDFVRVQEESGSQRWKALSVVSRVLIHYGFLVEGIIEKER